MTYEDREMLEKADIGSEAVCLNDRKIYRADCVHCTIRSRMLFSPLHIESIAHLLCPITHRVYGPRASIFDQGQPTKSIFSIRRGSIKLIQVSKSGQQRIVRLLGPGDCAGLEALTDEKYHQSAVAVTELDLCIIPIKTIDLINKTQPALWPQLVKQWQQQLKDTDDWLSELFYGTIIQRLCRFLLMQCRQQKLPACQIVLISNQDIASILATTDESISRCLSQLRNESILTRVQKRLYTLDIKVARTIADS